MNDKGKGKASTKASSSSTTVFDAISPMPPFFKELEALLGTNGKSKQAHEPLPGKFPPDMNLKISHPSPLEYSKSNPYPLCDICFEPFQVTHSPISAALTANSSAKLPFGLRLPCPGQHPYCISCLAQYIKGKLDPSGTGDMSTHIIVFPIRCPGCPIAHWITGIQDDVAEKVLDQDFMAIWVRPAPERCYGCADADSAQHHRRLLDSLPRQFCPNPKCSVLVQIDEDTDDPRAQCPACFQWVCVYCKAMWHKGKPPDWYPILPCLTFRTQDMSCEQYQSLPVDERSPEDQLAIALAQVPYPCALLRGMKLKPLIHRQKNGEGVQDATRSSS